MKPIVTFYTLGQLRQAKSFGVRYRLYRHCGFNVFAALFHAL